MSLSVTKHDRTTVLTVTTDTAYDCPLFCKILGALCCCPACFVPVRLRKRMDGTVTSLAAVQIMVGLFTIGLGAVLMSLYGGSYLMCYINAPYWLGSIFLISGIFSIFGERFSSPCMVGLMVLFNLAVAILAVVAVVFYSVDGWAVFGKMCSRYTFRSYHGDSPRVKLTDTELKTRDFNRQLCQMYEGALLPISIGLKALLLACAVLQLGVNISVGVLMIKALEKNNERKQVTEVQQPLMEEVTANPVA